MAFSVIIYSPDVHIQYDLDLLDNFGIGGGATARIRMAHALAARGNQVDLYINCPQEKRILGVNYHQFNTFSYQETDIFITSSSGGNLSFADLRFIPSAKVSKILLIEGDDFPKDIDLDQFNHYYVLSNYVRRKLYAQKPASYRYFVTNHGIQKDHFELGRIKNDPHKLVYASHPSKGLNSAIKIFEQLRLRDERFQLHVFGGGRLWGEQIDYLNNEYIEKKGIFYHGTVGQKLLAQELMACGFYLALQTRQEPFGIIINEALFAGCIVLASPVGAFPEIITNGKNGLLIEGDPLDDSTVSKTVSMIHDLIENPELMRRLSFFGKKTPLDWQDCAESWEAHWNSILNQPKSSSTYDLVCIECGGEEILLKDGIHCLKCGCYRK